MLRVKTSARSPPGESVGFLCVCFQDGFLLQPFEKDDRAAQDQAKKEDSCDKVDKPEKTQRKMLSRGETPDRTHMEMRTLDDFCWLFCFILEISLYL